MNPTKLVDGNRPTEIQVGDLLWVRQGERCLEYAVMRNEHFLHNQSGTQVMPSLTLNREFQSLALIFGHGVLTKFDVKEVPFSEVCLPKECGVRPEGWKIFQLFGLGELYR